MALTAADSLIKTGQGSARSGHRRRDLFAHSRLDRPLDLRSVRRWRRRLRAEAVAKARARSPIAASSPRASTPMAAIATSSMSMAGPSSTGMTGRPLRMEGREVFKHAVINIATVMARHDRGCRASRPRTSTGSFRIRPIGAFSKAPRRNSACARKRIVITLDKHGNTSAASIPLALDAAVRDGRIQARRPGPDGGDGRRLHLGRRARPLVRLAFQTLSY